MTRTLPWSDAQNTQAAAGWLELGNPTEAARALAEVDAARLQHPAVLEMRAKIYAAARQWHACLSATDQLTDVAPEWASGWLLLAQAQHGLHHTADACETLLGVLDRFPEDPSLACQLARYGYHLGWMREARQWLERALEISKTLALDLGTANDPILTRLLSNPTNPACRAQGSDC
jgi:predicted Zn-dependent protease